MGSHNELNEINIKNHTCSHFNKMIKIEVLILIMFYEMKNRT